MAKCAKKAELRNIDDSPYLLLRRRPFEAAEADSREAWPPPNSLLRTFHSCELGELKQCLLAGITSMFVSSLQLGNGGWGLRCAFRKKHRCCWLSR